MKAVIQRVEHCTVSVDGAPVSSIGRGLLVLLGIHCGDTESDIDTLARKCMGLRIFPDDTGRMNRSIADIGGAFMVVSQFTLFGDVRRGLRPYFGEAAEPAMAERFYALFMERLCTEGFTVAGGVFGAHMTVDIRNDGPVTIVIDTREPA